MIHNSSSMMLSFLLLLTAVRSSSSFAAFESTLKTNRCLQQRLFVSMGSLEDNFRSQKSGNDVSATVVVASRKEKSSSSANEDAWSARVANIVFSDSTNPVLLFDGVCNLCNEAVNLSLDLDEKQVFRFASLQSKVGRALLIQTGRDPDDRSTMVLVRANNDKPGKLELSWHIGSDAVLLMAAELQGLPPVVRWSARATRAVIPLQLREVLMKIVGNNRHLLGQADGPQCRLDLDGVYESRFVEDPDL